MEVRGWMQMERQMREVTFDVSDAEIENVGEDGLEMCHFPRA